jgi:voltage-gated sodium channel
VLRSRRWLAAVARSLETGRPRRVFFEQYQQHRKQIYKDLECGFKEYDPLKENGCCATVVKSQEFVVLSTTTVLLYVIWIAVDVEVNSVGSFADLPTSFQVVEHTFCTIFLLELLVRFGAFKRMRDCVWDLSFDFDAVLVATQATEIWLLPVLLGGTHVGFQRIARILRLARLGRIMRLLRFFPEVMTLIRGISRAMRSVFYTLILLLVLLFVFAIIFKSEAHEAASLQQLFPSIMDAVWTLLLKGVLMDGAAVTFYEILEDSWMLALLFMAFIFLSSFVVLNLLIGILCDVVCQVSQIEKDDSAVIYLKSTLMDLLDCYDKNGDEKLGKEEFELLMGNPEMHQILEPFDVDASGLMSMKDILFERVEPDTDFKPFPGDTRFTNQLSKRSVPLTFTEFIKAILRLRGANAATVMDMMDLREFSGRRLDGSSEEVAQLRNDVQELRLLLEKLVLS